MSTSPLPRFGVIGGVGPTATLWLYDRLVRLFRQHGFATQPDVVVHSLPMPALLERTTIGGQMSAEEAGNIETLLADSITVLGDCRVDVIMLACNSLHAFVDRAVARVGIGVPAIIDLPAKVWTRCSDARDVLVLGTSTTRALGVYDRFSSEARRVVYPEAGAQRALEETIQRAVTEGEDITRDLERIVESSSHRPDTILLACTDIDTSGLRRLCGVPVVGSLDTLAETAVELARSTVSVHAM